MTVREHSDNVFDAAKLEESPLPELGSQQVLLKFLAAPINPSDIMTISGRYGTTPAPCPLVVGFEGVAEVLEAGSDVTSVAVGDWVLAGSTGLGTWRDFAICKHTDVFTIDKKIGFKTAATLTVNPSTAYFLLTEQGIKPGQTVIQNGANSMVGKALIQIAKSMGIKTINVVRNRANIQVLTDELKALGADTVVTDDKLNEIEFEEKAVVAIDCVAGAAGAMLFRHLQSGGTFVNYGALSGEPIPVSPLDLIFKNLTVKGYHLTNSIVKDKAILGKEVFPYIARLAAEGKYKSPEFEMFSLEDFKKGLERATAGFSNKKQLIVMDNSLM